MGATLCRAYATNGAVPSSTSVIAAELMSLRTTWRMVAETITTMIPAAAQLTSHGLMRVSARQGERIRDRGAMFPLTPLISRLEFE